MDRFAGGCLCGNVRIVASGLPYRSVFVTVSIAASIMGPSVTIDGETRDQSMRGGRRRI
jgi:hypothetical protein